MRRRRKISRKTIADVTSRCRRRCAICFGLNADKSPKKGQIVHLDRDNQNRKRDNLVWLCLAHHEEYDSRSFQAKGYVKEEVSKYRDELQHFLIGHPIPQKVKWGPNDGLGAGITVGCKDGIFIPWLTLREEIERQLLIQAGRFIPRNCHVEVGDLFGRKNWIVSIFNKAGRELGRVWFGLDPDRDWRFDGLVRIGSVQTIYSAEVWEVYQRQSDGTYRLLHSKSFKEPIGHPKPHTAVALLQKQ